MSEKLTVAEARAEMLATKETKRATWLHPWDWVDGLVAILDRAECRCGEKDEEIARLRAEVDELEAEINTPILERACKITEQGAEIERLKAELAAGETRKQKMPLKEVSEKLIEVADSHQRVCKERDTAKAALAEVLGKLIDLTEQVEGGDVAGTILDALETYSDGVAEIIEAHGREV